MLRAVNAFLCHCVVWYKHSIHPYHSVVLQVDWSKFIAVNGATAHPHYDPDGTTYNMGNSYGRRGLFPESSIHAKVYTVTWLFKIYSFIYLFLFFYLDFFLKRNELYFVGGKEVQQLAVSNHSKCLDSNPVADSGLYVKSASSLPLQAFQLPPRVHGHAH